MKTLVCLIVFVALACGQCATSYDDAFTDGNTLYTGSTLTDNYTDAYSGCTSWGTFYHTYTINLRLVSPSGRVTYGYANSSAGSNSGSSVTTAFASLPINGEYGEYTSTGNTQIDCSVAGTGFYQAYPVGNWYIALKTTYFENSRGSQVVATQRFCGYTAACSNGVQPACFPLPETTTVVVPASQQCPPYWAATFIAVRKNLNEPYTCTVSIAGPVGGPGVCDP